MAEIIIAIVLFIVGALWWFRRRMIRTAARDVTVQLGRIRQSVRQERQRARYDVSQIMAADDPVVAATILIMAIITDGRRNPGDRERVLLEVMAGVSTPDRAREAVTIARSVAAHAIDTGFVIDMLTPILCKWLDEAEKSDFIAMARRVATASGPLLPALETRMHRLRQKLGVAVH